MIAVIAGFALLNLVLYSGVVQGEEARPARGPAGARLPGPGNAPGLTDARIRAQEAELDESDALPGRFVSHQGRSHVDPGQRVEFCPPGQVSDDCYASNPPTSGLHLPVDRNVVLPSGDVVNIPPDPGIYDFEVPRESIPHLQEHAGVFVAYRCVSAGCRDVLERLEALVAQELALGARVVMAPSGDLEDDTIALASWTRVDAFDATDYTDERVRAFIKAHSCRFDPEGFCPDSPLNRSASPPTPNHQTTKRQTPNTGPHL